MINKLIWLASVSAIVAALGWAHQALAQQRTIYSNDGYVVGRYTTDSQGTTTLYDRDGRVISRDSGNTTIIHDGVSGQVYGDRARRELRSKSK